MKTLISALTLDQAQQPVTIAGRIVHARSSGKICFLELRDGSGFIQCVGELSTLGDEKFAQLTALGIESSLSLTGTLSRHPKKPELELQITDFQIFTATSDYPLGQKEHGPDFLFDQRHLHLRARSQRAIQRVRNTVIQATYQRFATNNFIKIDAPVFTPSSCEDTTELYEVEHVNGEKMFLSQSGQLYLEAAIAAHGRVFDFGPVFRAEKSKTRRHLNEFRMMDAEMAFVEHEQSLEIQENLIFFILEQALSQHESELQILDRDLEALRQIKKPFLRKSYDEVIELLKSLGSDIEFGQDLWADDETMLMTELTQPLFVTGYPSSVKAFYMKEDPSKPGFVRNADLLAPEGIGEIIGGSERESDYETLRAKIRAQKLPEDQFARYLDTRKFGGVPHSGFGYGLERIVRWLCGLHHIRETIPFPRYANRITP